MWANWLVWVLPNRVRNILCSYDRSMGLAVTLRNRQRLARQRRIVPLLGDLQVEIRHSVRKDAKSFGVGRRRL